MPIITNAASFDCKKAKQPLEKLICANPELSAIDERMGAIYKKVKVSFPLKEFVSDTQIYFVAGDYKNCMYINDDWSKQSSSPQAVKNCITVVQRRIDELQSYQQSKVYSDKDENLVALIYQNNSGKKAMRLWGKLDA
jgi:uncharacterized protein